LNEKKKEAKEKGIRIPRIEDYIVVEKQRRKETIPKIENFIVIDDENEIEENFFPQSLILRKLKEKRA